MLNDKLALTAALFQIDTTNARVTLPNNQYAMVGNKRVQGLELGVAGQLTKQWQLFGGYTYMKSELRDNGRTRRTTATGSRTRRSTASRCGRTTT